MKMWRLPLLAGTILTTCVFLAIALWFSALLRETIAQLPRLPENPHELSARGGTEIYAANGERIYTFNQSRQWVDLEHISPHAVAALLATEDSRFYDHAGVDLKALGGALWANLRHGFGTRGGSTLTQQLVKRLFFSREKTLRRKLGEMLIALELEALYAQRFPGQIEGRPRYKDRLIELYLNTAFYGSNAYGLHDAAAIFFATTPDSLSIEQAALLVGLVNAPSAYNPLQHPERASRRLQHVLTRMQRNGYLSTQQRVQYDSLRAEKLVDVRRTPLNPAPYWVEAIKAEVVRRWDAETLRYGALRIHTTLDMRRQKAAEEAVERGLQALDERMAFAPYEQAALAARKTYVQAALVSLDPHTGQVAAMVGGRDIFISYYNRALSARRQPGSGFKPIAYLAAFADGDIGPLSLFYDAPYSYEVNGETWSPRNFADSYLGLTTAAQALYKSANSTAVQLVRQIGPEKVVEMARQLGFTSPIGPYQSIALGVSEVTVLEMAAAYGALANYGLYIEPTLVARITDAEGRELFAHEPGLRQAISPTLAYQMTALLELVVDQGSGRRVRSEGFLAPAAGKTGTTNDNTDAWFTGYTPDLVTSVWVGFDERKEYQLVDAKGQQITGGNGAVPIWAGYMKEAVVGARSFAAVGETHRARVDPQSGLDIAADDSLSPAIDVLLRRGQRTNSRDEVREFIGQLQEATTDSTLSQWLDESSIISPAP